MKKFINDPANLTRELLEGYCLAYSDKVRLLADGIIGRTQPKAADKVAIVTLGGAGHEPALSGFVGRGMLDFSVVGDIFAAPAGPRVFEALKLAHRPAGVLLVVLNHAGDVMAGNIAMQLAQKAGLTNIRTVLTHEDIAPGADAPAGDRRGLVGCIPLYKVAGAVAEAGGSLEHVAAAAERYNQNMATLAVALKPATHPASGQEIFQLAEDEMEIGMGQHGEAGTGRSKMKNADETAGIMLNQLLGAVKARPGDKVFVMINGVGATTLMEQYIVMRQVGRLLRDRGVILARARVGEFLTVQEMAGFQMHVAKVDDELVRLLGSPCDTAYWGEG